MSWRSSGVAKTVSTKSFTSSSLLLRRDIYRYGFIFRPLTEREGSRYRLLGRPAGGDGDPWQTTVITHDQTEEQPPEEINTNGLVFQCCNK